MGRDAAADEDVVGIGPGETLSLERTELTLKVQVILQDCIRLAVVAQDSEQSDFVAASSQAGSE